MSQPALIRSLLNPACYPPPVTEVVLIETHISWVLLTGAFAYKIKKPVDLGFLDFSTLERRRHFCEEELRLNRRTAPDIYRKLVAIGGSPQAPRLDSDGAPLEYAVQMRQFPQDSLLSEMLTRDAVTPGDIDRLAAAVARFHQEIATAGPDTPWGTPERVHHPVVENFAQIRERLPQPPAALARIEAWSEAAFARLAPLFEQRRRAGFVRECHGDLHLGNIACLDGRMTPFDCIEFNPSLRWIDLMSEVAFLTMDLEDRHRPDLATRLLDGWLQHSGDYAGLPLLRYYQCYRAMVRAKVAAIRLGQPALTDTERQSLQREFAGYLTLAEGYTRPARPQLLITHGLSGSGKTSQSQPLLEALGAIRLRSDIERKRLFGLAPLARSASGVGGGIYSEEAGRRTYAHLLKQAETILQAGFPLIVDATFLAAEQRVPFRQLAQRLGVPFHILHFEAPEAILRERLHRRSAEARDASEAGVEVLERQLAHYHPLGAEERAETLTLDTTAMPAPDTLLARLQAPAPANMVD